VEFADPIVSVFSDFVDPLQAHAKHVAEPGIIELMLCGADRGELSENVCLVPAAIEDAEGAVDDKS